MNGPEVVRGALLAQLFAFLLITSVIFMPRPPIVGAQFLLYPLLGTIALVIVLLYGLNGISTKSKSLVWFVTAVSLTYSAEHILSLLINNLSIRQVAVIESLRPILLLLLLVAGLSVGRKGTCAIEKALAWAARFTLIGQTFLCSLQAVNIRIFDSIYSAEKAFGLSSIFRVTGSLSNPNTLGWIVNHMTIVAVLTSRNRWTLMFWFLLGSLLTLATGSRSQFLLFAPAILFAVWLKRGAQISLKIIGILSIGLAIVIGGLVGTLYLFKDTFKYLWEVIRIFETGDLSSVRTFQKRLDLWDSRWSLFKVQANDLNWIFGLGPIPEFRVTDNDYLYVIAKYGLMGLGLQLILCLFLIYVFWKYASPKLRGIGVTYVVFAMILGLQVETMGGWLYPLLPFFYAGIALSSSETRTEFQK